MVDLYHSLSNSEDINSDLLQETTRDLPLRAVVSKLKSLQEPDRKTLSIAKPHCVLISPDGSIYFGQFSGKIGVIHQESFLIDNFKEHHSKIVNSLSITPNGQHLISTSNDNSVKIWKIPERTCVTELKDFTDLKIKSAVSADSSKIALGGRDSLIHIYNIATSSYEQVISEHKDWVLCLEFSQDNLYLISGSRDKTIKIFNIESGTCQNTVEAHAGGVNALKTLKNGKQLVSAGGDRVVKVWNIENGFKLMHILEGHSGWVSSIAISNDEKFCLTSSSDKLIKIWNLETMKLEFTWIGHEDWIHNLALSHDNKIVASCSRDSKLILWKFQKSPEAVSFIAHEDTVNYLLVTHDNQRIISSSRDKLIKVWNRDSLECIATLSGHESWVVCLGVSKNDIYLASASRDKNIILWNLQNYSQISVITGHTDSIYCLQFLNSGDYLASGSRDKSIRVWNISTYEVEHIIDQCSDIVNCLTITSDDYYLITGTGNSLIEIWSISERSIVKSLSGHTDSIYSILTTSDDRYIISGSKDKTIRIWNLAAGRQEAILTGHSEWVSDLAITYDNKFIISTSWDGTLRVWNIENRTQEAVIYYECLEITSVVISRDNRYIFTGGLNKKVSIYDTMDYFMNTGCRTKEQEKEIVFYNNTYYFRKASYLQLTDHQDWMNNVKIGPFGVTILHIYCYYGYSDKLKAALKSGCMFFKRESGQSPLTYAIERNSQKCIDIILEYIISINSTEESRASIFIQAINNDIIPLIAKGSVFLKDFFSVLFCQALQKELPDSGIPIHTLPSYIFNSFYYINASDFLANSSAKDEEVFLTFTSTRFPYNYESGSYSSIALLKSIRDSNYPDIYNIPYIESIIRLKWNNLWLFTLLFTVLYWISLCVFCMLIFWGFDKLYLNIPFIALNVLFMLYEVFQCIASGNDYFIDIWNGIDIVRGALSLVWIGLEMNGVDYKIITWILVILNWLRGLTFFRAFAYTRYFVRMVLETAKDSLAFMVIFAYSTLGFGLMFAATDPKIESLGAAWIMSYELNHGEFKTDGYDLLQYTCFTLATLINVIIMLNLLISILGDSFERFQMRAKEADLIEMLDIVYEFEKLMVWKRYSGSLTYLQKAGYSQETESEIEWQGRIKAIENTISASSFTLKTQILNFQSSLSSLEEKNSALQKELREESFHLIQSLQSNLESLNSRLTRLETSSEHQFQSLLEAITSLKS
jgi:WD40 repeat protein